MWLSFIFKALAKFLAVKSRNSLAPKQHSRIIRYTDSKNFASAYVQASDHKRYEYLVALFISIGWQRRCRLGTAQAYLQRSLVQDG